MALSFRVFCFVTAAAVLSLAAACTGHDGDSDARPTAETTSTPAAGTSTSNPAAATSMSTPAATSTSNPAAVPSTSTPAATSTSTLAAATSTATQPPGAGQAVSIETEIEGFAFRDPSIVVAVGSTVVWTNRDAVAHTVTAADGSFDSGLLADCEEFAMTFNQAGSFQYICSLHPSMQGTVTVQ